MGFLVLDNMFYDWMMYLVCSVAARYLYFLSSSRPLDRSFCCCVVGLSRPDDGEPAFGGSW